MRLLALMLLFLMCSGCTVFTPPMERPIIRHEVGVGWGGSKFETLSATADRRILLVSPDTNRACAEPSPDALVSLASSFGAAIAASKEDIAELQSAIAKELVTSTTPIAYRTQGLAFYRDMAFQACQLWMNIASSSVQPGQTSASLIEAANTTYKEMLKSAAELARPLIEKEIALMPQLFPHQSKGPEKPVLKGTPTRSLLNHGDSGGKEEQKPDDGVVAGGDGEEGATVGE